MKHNPFISVDIAIGLLVGLLSSETELASSLTSLFIFIVISALQNYFYLVSCS